MNVAAFGIGVLGLLIGTVLCLVALFKALGFEKVEDMIIDEVAAIDAERSNASPICAATGHRPDRRAPDQNSPIPGRISAHASSKEVRIRYGATVNF